MGRTPLGVAVRLVTLASATLGTISRVVIASFSGGGLNVLGYFTVQANLLVLIYLALVVSASARSGKGGPSASLLTRFVTRAHGGVLIYIVVTAIVYNTVLSSGVDLPGYSGFVLLVNHTVTPILFFIDWLMNHDREPYGMADVGRWLIYPIAYAVFASIEGGITREFRYFFLDFVRPSFRVYALQMGAVVALFVLLGLAIVGGNRLIIRRMAPRAEGVSL